MAKNEKPRKGKVVPELTAIQWGHLFSKVNIGPAIQDRRAPITMEEFKNRETLYDKLTEGCEIDEENGTMNFLDKEGMDLYLTNQEWRILVDCLKKSTDDTMFLGKRNKQILALVENAEECELAEKPI